MRFIAHLFLIVGFTLLSNAKLISLSRLRGEADLDCERVLSYHVSNAETELNGAYVCEKTGRPRLVWTLASTIRGTLYFCVPATSTSPGLPELGVWKPSIKNKLTSFQEPIITRLDFHDQSLDDLLKARMLLSCGAWKVSIHVLSRSSDQSVLMKLELALIQVREAWNLPEAVSILESAWSMNPSLDVSALLALLMCINGRIPYSYRILHHATIHLSHKQEANITETMTQSITEAYGLLSSCASDVWCQAQSMKNVIELGYKTLLKEVEAITTSTILNQYSFARDVNDLNGLDLVGCLKSFLAATSCTPSSLANTQLMFASSVLSLGDHDSAARHLAQVILENCHHSETELARREHFDIQVLDRLLLTIVPPVPSSMQHTEEVTELVSLTVNTIVNKSSGWMNTMEVGHFGLGIRWQFLLAYLGGNDSDVIYQIRQNIVKGLINIQPQLIHHLPYEAAHKPNTTLRPKLGFISSFWRYHSVGRLLVPLIEHLALNGFDVMVIHTSNIKVINDTVSRKLHQAQSSTKGRLTQHWFHGNISEIHNQLLGLDLHVLIWGDIGMDTLTSSLALGRYAPVQCSFWGHPVTSASPSIDYFITSSLFEYDRLTSIRAKHSEQLVRLCGINTMFAQPIHDPQLASQYRKEILSSASVSTATNLSRIYICAQTQSKIHPRFDRLLKRILEEDQEGVVVLSRNPLVPISTKIMTDRLSSVIHPSLRHRIVFIDQTPNSSHFQALQCSADVILDPIVFGGGVTILEALACPVPVVTAPLLQTVLGLGAGMLLDASMKLGEITFDEVGVMLQRKDIIRLSLGTLVHSAEDYAHEAVRLAQRNSPALPHIPPSFWESGDVGSDWAVFLRSCLKQLSLFA